jgi:hypothetical protein
MIIINNNNNNNNNNKTVNGANAAAPEANRAQVIIQFL